MKYQKLILYTFIFTGLGCMIITMFHPFEMYYNRLIPTVLISIVVCLGYFLQSFNYIKASNISQSNNLESKSFSSTALEKNYEQLFYDISKKIEVINLYSKNADNYRELQLQLLCNEFQFGQGLIFDKIIKNDGIYLTKTATYAFFGDSDAIEDVEWGMDITGQAAKNGEFIYIDNVPKGHLQIASGLGTSNPNILVLAPFKINNEVAGVVELAGFQTLNDNDISHLKKVINFMFV